MVALMITPAIRAAIDEHARLTKTDHHDLDQGIDTNASNIQHLQLVGISDYLTHHSAKHARPTSEWRLDTLLKGTAVYRPQPSPPTEKTAEYKALMARLRHQEEQRQYERMLNPMPQRETFSQRFPMAHSSFAAGGNTAQGDADGVDEVTYADVNRQVILIINVLVSIIACSIAVWIAARRWSIPQRLGLAFFSSTLVAVAEVVIYMGYVQRIKTAKDKEGKKVETKEIVDTWVIDHKSSSSSSQPADGDNVRFRKGKHR